MKKLVIFDMDGLLIDSERIYRDMWKETFIDFKIAISEEELAAISGKSFLHTKAYIDELLGDPLMFDKLRTVREGKFWGEIETNGLPIKEGAQELLEELNKRNVDTALATSTYETRALKLLEKSGLKHYFKEMIFGDMVDFTKPHPQMFDTLRKDFGLKHDEVVILEDSYSGVKAANSAGIDVIWIKDFTDLSTSSDLVMLDQFDSLIEATESILSLTTKEHL